MSFSLWKGFGEGLKKVDPAKTPSAHTQLPAQTTPAIWCDLLMYDLFDNKNKKKSSEQAVVTSRSFWLTSQLQRTDKNRPSCMSSSNYHHTE